MPERANGAREASDTARNAIITDAVTKWPSARESGAAPLEDYFRLVPTEVLAAAGSERIANTVARHEALGRARPQGRAAVEVRDGGDASLTGTDTVVDVVTDDMPYLVDSVTMELNRHGADVRLIVHPVLSVHRDVTGVITGKPGAKTTEDSDGRESWIHVELGPVDDRAALDADLRRVLDDVRVTYEDQRRMRAAARALVESLTESGGPEEAETGQLLAWLAAGHFTFLGYREYDLAPGSDPKPVTGSGLGILRHDGAGSDPDALPAVPGTAGPGDDRLLVLAKSSTKSTVYKPAYLDYVAVRKYDDAGQVTGEYRFVGLYTQAAYTESITRIPVLRQKLDQTLEASGLDPESHDGKELVEILEGYPREELFEVSAEQLTPIALGVLSLGERKQVRLFLRPDAYGRYMSCLVYLPRDRYTTEARLRAQEILRSALGGASVEYSAMVTNSALARLHVVVHAAPGTGGMPEVDAAGLEAEIAAALRSWDEDLMEEAERQLGAARAARLLSFCGRGIPEAYKSDVAPAAAVRDLDEVLKLRDSAAPFSSRLRIHPNGSWRLSIFRAQSPMTLSSVLPQLQHMGLEVVDEHPYEFSRRDNPFWIYEFGLRKEGVAAPDVGTQGRFEDALAALWREECEDDEFNTLVLDAGLRWRQVVVLRAYARYLRQIRTRYSQEYLQRVLRANPAITRLLVRLFESRFDPDMRSGADERSEAIVEELRGELDEVTVLDHDRILRSYLALIEATLRTNYFQGERSEPGQHSQPHAPTLTFKLASERVTEAPLPRPKFEIFVYSPRLEAVHLRFGAVARGGLRWSERPEDFRTEILGLVKAQEVKNSVIVPSGAKGGFVCKRLPDPADREAFAGEVLACYRAFIGTMLDITDNLSGDDVIPPRNVVRLDGDDPYLVVAADKGTATFSDVANEIAQARGFWLDDAFASGGSEGYDHKKMGITARGAWESVRWHFASLGINVDTDDFTVAGVGDMSGDVFGNGMLLSRHIRLVAAFDHRHVFLDPAPDAATGFAERNRIFALPRSSWDDYDRSLISAGGGVWPRTAKSVPLSAQARAALGLDDSVAALSPDDLINAILKAPVDLLWNGGIGTYVKASHETHAAAGDRSNDAVRVDAAELRARVIGEGGNLGLTQAARIEYALAGGLVNTDFIDNSAGVDTSDHEVNIKILLGHSLEPGERGRLLHEMTDEVAALVLKHNDGQNMALAAARYQAPRLLHVHTRYLRKLERDKRLSREQDMLPSDKEIATRRSAGTGLTAPELSLLLAHTKIAAGQEVLASDLPDDPHLQSTLTSYFPAPLREKYSGRMASHQLRREIITTSVVNEMVDTGGSTFLFRLGEETSAAIGDITRAWLVTRAVFGMPDFWRQVEGLAGQVDVDTRIGLVLEARKLVERSTRWLLMNRRPPFVIDEAVGFLRDGVVAVRSAIPTLLAGQDLSGFNERRDSFTARGVPAALAGEVAAMVPSYSACDIVESAVRTGRDVTETAAVYFALADRLQIGPLRDLITALPREDRWSSMARSALRDELYAAHAALTRDVLAAGGQGTAAERVEEWVSRNEAAVSRCSATLGEIWESERFNFTTLSVACRIVRTLVPVGA